MTRPPQPSNERLDAGERALAAMLPRPHGRTEPGPDLDARILAAAHAATQPQPAVRRPRRSWIAPTAVAASLVLALGLAWQLRPPAAPMASEQVADADANAAQADADAMAVRAIMAPPPAAAEQRKPSIPAPMVQALPAPAPAPATPPVAEKRQAAAVVPADAGEVAAAPAAVAAPPPPPPAPATVGLVGEAAAMPQAAEPARAQATAKSRESDGIRQRASATGNAAAQAQEAAEHAAADAATLDTVTFVGDPGEDVPPATAASPEVRDAWLRRIGELLKQGQTEEAKASLTEFKRRYPDASLPPELRKLEP